MLKFYQLLVWKISCKRCNMKRYLSFFRNVFAAGLLFNFLHVYQASAAVCFLPSGGCDIAAKSNCGEKFTLSSIPSGKTAANGWLCTSCGGKYWCRCQEHKEEINGKCYWTDTYDRCPSYYYKYNSNQGGNWQCTQCTNGQSKNYGKWKCDCNPQNVAAEDRPYYVERCLEYDSNHICSDSRCFLDTCKQEEVEKLHKFIYLPSERSNLYNRGFTCGKCDENLSILKDWNYCYCEDPDLDEDRNPPKLNPKIDKRNSGNGYCAHWCNEYNHSVNDNGLTSYNNAYETKNECQDYTSANDPKQTCEQETRRNSDYVGCWYNVCPSQYSLNPYNYDECTGNDTCKGKYKSGYCCNLPRVPNGSGSCVCHSQYTANPANYDSCLDNGTNPTCDGKYKTGYCCNLPKVPNGYGTCNCRSDFIYKYNSTKKQYCSNSGSGSSCYDTCSGTSCNSKYSSSSSSPYSKCSCRTGRSKTSNSACACPSDYPYYTYNDSTACTSGMSNLQECVPSRSGSYCYKRQYICDNANGYKPDTVLTDLAQCSSNGHPEGWKFVTQSGKDKCRKCEKKDCPAGSSTSGGGDPTGDYSGDSKCFVNCPDIGAGYYNKNSDCTSANSGKTCLRVTQKHNCYATCETVGAYSSSGLCQIYNTGKTCVSLGNGCYKTCEGIGQYSTIEACNAVIGSIFCSLRANGCYADFGN